MRVSGGGTEAKESSMRQPREEIVVLNFDVRLDFIV